jgi:type IV secretory pathway VirB2 component (pilin)
MVPLASLADPPAVSVIAAAARWAEASISGTLATTVAVIAIAIVGLRMLDGRIDARRGVTVIMGCFVLFGAPIIARGLLGVTRDIANVDDQAFTPPPALPAQVTQETPPSPPPPPFDPYAGAAVPQRR